MLNDKNTYWESLKQEFAPTGFPYVSTNSMPLSTYIDTVSNGQWPIVTSYVQDPDETATTIEYITLPYSLADYPDSSDFTLVRDTMLAMRERNPDTTHWDLNNDGLIDNLSILVQLPGGKNGYNSGSFLVPHRATGTTGVTINGLDVDHHLILPATQMSSGGFTIGSSNDTIKHGYLHTIGIWDLYRGGEVGNTQGGVPVGIWSIMGQANRAWPLAQEREDLGWVTIPTVDIASAQSQQITLHKPYSADGDQAIRIASPFNDSESFVIEYRQQTPKYQGNIDAHLPDSGAIIYRVNDAVNNTHDGKSNVSLDGQVHDYIYVFRQDSETATSGLVPSTAVLSPDRVTDYGSANLANTTNAIVGAQGRNTGIVVKVVSETADSITLEISQADTASVSIWTPVGAGSQSAVNASGSLAASSSSIARSSATGGSGRFTTNVETSTGDAWTGAASPFSGDFGDVQLAYLGDTLYATAPNYGTGSLEIKKFEGGTWSNVSTLSGLGNTPVYFGSSNGTLYVAGATGNGSQAKVYSSTGGNFTQVGGTVSGQYLSNFALANVNGTVQLAVSDIFGGNHKVYTLQGSSWNASTIDSGAMKTMSLISVGSSSYELLLDASGTLQLRQLSSTDQVQSTADLTGVPAKPSLASLAISADKAFIVTESNGTLAVYSASLSDLNTWTQLGENVTTSGTNPEIEVVGSTVYVLYKDTAAQTINVYQHDVA
ncbi:hypothetical protein HF984_01820 [Rothia terrae]|nr:hypothetical protein [Rothia terrae]NKZ33525.1 hypothetical protein [Rothia terrae]